MSVTPFTLTGSGQTDLSIDARKDGHQHSVVFDGTLDMAVVEMFLYGTESAAGTEVAQREMDRIWCECHDECSKWVSTGDLVSPSDRVYSQSTPYG